jgi:molecular chaperone DnaK
MTRIVGIDLGTTYTSIGFVNDHGKPEIIPNREGERITPSVVMFDGESPIVGSIAKRSAVANPEEVVQFVKRQMGVPSWKFRTGHGETFTAEEISAIILKRLKGDAEVHLGGPVHDAVITVPAYFNDAQRKATQDAGRIAGLNVLRIINEPTAAALAYGMDRLEEDHTILVYDLGGGTFDVTIMRIAGGGIEVVSSGGDKNLGGFDWDNALMEHLNDAFIEQGGRDLLEDPALTQDLRDKAEIAKKTLSTRDKTNVFLSADGKNATIGVTLETFNDLTRKLIKRTGHILDFVREDAGMEWRAIDKVLLVGGSTRMKAVPELIEKITGKKPSLELHPDEVVTLGAALQAEILAVKRGGSALVERQDFPLVEISDVTAHSLGVVAVDDMERPYNSIVLPKDSKIPGEARNEYMTVADNQTKLHVQVTQGEESDLEGNVTVITEKTLEIPPYPKGAPIEVCFKYDENTIIQLEVFDKTANRSLGEILIDRPANLDEQSIAAMGKKLKNIEVN